jgi:hypothetical protein
MSNVALARPSTVASVFIDAPTTVASVQGVGTVAGTFRMKAKRVRVSVSCRAEDSTGDIDSYSTFVSDIMPRTQVQLVGFMVAGSAINLANMAATSNGDHGIKIWFHSNTRFIQGKCVFRSITVDAGRDDPYVQVTIDAVFTNTNPNLLESTTVPA